MSNKLTNSTIRKTISLTIGWVSVIVLSACARITSAQYSYPLHDNRANGLESAAPPLFKQIPAYQFVVKPGNPAQQQGSLNYPLFGDVPVGGEVFGNPAKREMNLRMARAPSAENNYPNWNQPVEPLVTVEPLMTAQPVVPAVGPATFPQDKVIPSAAGGVPQAKDFKLAPQPKLGDRYFNEVPVGDANSVVVEPMLSDFQETPINPYQAYDSEHQKWVYSGKTLNANRRPLLELGRPWYQLGQLAPPSTILGFHNPVSPQLLVFGDMRTVAASNRVDGDSSSLLAWQLNLNVNLSITSTERFVFFASPFDRDGRSTRWLLDEDTFVDELDPNINFGFFEGDLGAIVGGLTQQTLPFDLPFAVGFMPVLAQNGVWLDDTLIGVAATIPARNSPALNISNIDTTFLWAFDEVTSPAFEGDDDAAQLFAVLTFIEALGGYFEIDYGFLEDSDLSRGRSYHNIGIGFTRRYGRWISNSVRVIANTGQQTRDGDDTAEGLIVLMENSLITSQPSTFVPYFNLWAGFDRPQSAARANAAGGILRNTGILFESDGLTGFPTLDATGNDTYGAAIGLNIIAPDFSQQLVLEAGFLQFLEDTPGGLADDRQYGLGLRYQLPLTNSVILRTDAMYGFIERADDISGVRVELRQKF